MATMTEHLGKLRTLADGALKSIDRRSVEEPKTDHSRQRSFWQGYRQCIDDVEDFHQKNPREGTPQ